MLDLVHTTLSVLIRPDMVLFYPIIMSVIIGAFWGWRSAAFVYKRDTRDIKDKARRQQVTYEKRHCYDMQQLYDAHRTLDNWQHDYYKAIEQRDAAQALVEQLQVTAGDKELTGV